MPTPKSVSDIKAKLLNPALTSHFEVRIPVPPGLQNNIAYLQANGLQQFVGINQDTLNLLCCDTSLPGSNIGTMDITGDYHGATQRFANRRIYDDRIDMTFYVDAENYLPIRYFEVWMKYIVGESIASGRQGDGGRPGAKSPQYYYRLNYPSYYISEQGLQVIKFERDYKKSLVYDFINAFPISVTSMPVSYESSSLLKCTVSFTYLRYILNPPSGQEPEHPDSGGGGSQSSPTDPSTPNTQAIFNNAQFAASDITAPGLEGIGALNTTGGVPLSSANASGNTVKGVTQSDINSALSAERSLVTNQ